MGPENVGSDSGSDRTWAKPLTLTALFSLPFYDMTPSDSHYFRTMALMYSTFKVGEERGFVFTVLLTRDYYS